MEAGERKVKSGAEYDHLFPPALMITEVYKKGARLADTMRLIPIVIRETKWQTEKIARELKGKTIHETCSNIWNFVYTHVKYRKDEKGKEQIRSPARTWADRFLGVDCDCYSVFIGSILSVLKIRFELRITKYSENYFQHIYPIVPFPDGGYITIDCVVNRFDYEEPYSENKDMELEILSGIEARTKAYNDQAAMAELGRILKKAAARKSEPAKKVQVLPSKPAQPLITNQKKPILQQPATKAASVPKKNPASAAIIQAFKNAAAKPQAKIPQKLPVLPSAQAKPQQKAIPQTLKPQPTQTVKPQAAKPQPQPSKSKPKGIKKAVKKVEEGAKKVSHVVNKVPLSLLRSGILVAMKLNAGKIAESLRWSYLSADQASSKGADMSRYDKLKQTRSRLEKVFYTAGGKPANLKTAMLKGKGNSDKAVSLAGLDDEEDEILSGELGNPALAAAAGVIATFGKLIKDIGDVFPKKNKAAASSATASSATSSSTTDETEAEVPEVDETPKASAGKTQIAPASTDEDERTDSAIKNLPARSDSSPPGGFVSEDKLTEEKNDKSSFWDKNKSWLKPVGIGVGAVGLAYAGYKILAPAKKQNNSLSGVEPKPKQRKYAPGKVAKPKPKPKRPKPKIKALALM